MELLLAALGIGLILFTLVDALWTALWVDGAAGPLTRRATTWAWRGLLRVVGRQRHRALSLFGPVLLVTTLMAWVGLVLAGWFLLFSADPQSLSSTGPPEADWTGRVWFIAYSFFTVGNGDFIPKPGVWQIAASLIGATGMVLITLAISYLLSVISAVVSKRAFASQITGLGETPEALVKSGWNGHDLRPLDRLLADLSSQLGQLTQQYESYPLLQYYHAAHPSRSPIRAVAIFDDALTLMQFGVAPDARPGPAELASARASVKSFLGTLRSALISPATEAPPGPELGALREHGIPAVPEHEFQREIQQLDDRRRSLLGLVQGDGWTWDR